MLSYCLIMVHGFSSIAAREPMLLRRERENCDPEAEATPEDECEEWDERRCRADETAFPFALLPLPLFPLMPISLMPLFSLWLLLRLARLLSIG